MLNLNENLDFFPCFYQAMLYKELMVDMEQLEQKVILSFCSFKQHTHTVRLSRSQSYIHARLEATLDCLWINTYVVIIPCYN